MDISSKSFAAFVAAASCLRFYGNGADRQAGGGESKSMMPGVNGI